MFWKITKDHLGDEPQAVGKGNGTPTEMKKSELITFKLYDDDGELYYSGVCDAEAYDDDDDPAGLYGALQWGAWNAGCTDLRLKLEDVQRLAPGSAETYARLARQDGWVSIFG